MLRILLLLLSENGFYCPVALIIKLLFKLILRGNLYWVELHTCVHLPTVSDKLENILCNKEAQMGRD
jgi:hypothetical protein